MENPDVSFNFDNKGWEIPFLNLPTPIRGVSPYIFLQDKLFESSDKEYACFFYTITEYRMGFYIGLIAIFKNKDNPTLIVSPINQWFDYQGEDSIYFFDKFIFVRKLAYNKNEEISGTPFVIFDLDKNRFGFIDFDWSSIYYSIQKVSGTVFEFYPDDLNELNRLTITRAHERFDVSAIKYCSFDQVDNLMELYFEERKASISKRNT